jgi:hypothetical protein
MRLPMTNNKYDQARTGQAYPYFMPWLSGDNGASFVEFYRTSFLIILIWKGEPSPAIL